MTYCPTYTLCYKALCHKTHIYMFKLWKIKNPVCFKSPGNHTSLHSLISIDIISSNMNYASFKLSPVSVVCHYLYFNFYAEVLIHYAILIPPCNTFIGHGKKPTRAPKYGFSVTEENELMNVHTLLTVSLTAGTGKRGKDVWKLYNMGLRPEKSFTSAWKKPKTKYTPQIIRFNKRKMAE